MPLIVIEVVATRPASVHASQPHAFPPPPTPRALSRRPTTQPGSCQHAALQPSPSPRRKGRGLAAPFYIVRKGLRYHTHGWPRHTRAGSARVECCHRAYSTYMQSVHVYEALLMSWTSGPPGSVGRERPDFLVNTGVAGQSILPARARSCAGHGRGRRTL